MTEEPASARSTGTRRRTRRTGTRSTTTRRRTTSARRRVGGTELVSNLNQMVDQLIKENRKLKQQLKVALGKAYDQL